MCTITKNESYNSFEIIFNGKPDEQTRNVLKANGYRWHGVRRLWYGYKDIAEQLNGTTTAIEQHAIVKAEQNTDKEQQTALIEKYIAIYNATFKSDDKFNKWLRGQIARIVELDSDELLEIEKPSIKTDFCFGYGYNGISTQQEIDDAYDAMHYADTNESYFMRKNLEQLTDTRDRLREYLNRERPDYCGTSPRVPYLCDRYDGSKIKSLYFMRVWDYEEMHPNTKKLYRQATADELHRILSAYEIEIKVFEKRLQTYLKRYGLSKLHTWTYLSD